MIYFYYTSYRIASSLVVDRLGLLDHGDEPLTESNRFRSCPEPPHDPLLLLVVWFQHESFVCRTLSVASHAVILSGLHDSKVPSWTFDCQSEQGRKVTASQGIGFGRKQLYFPGSMNDWPTCLIRNQQQSMVWQL